MAQGRGNEHAIQDHLGHARTEVMAMFGDIVGEPRRDEFLKTRESTRGEHLGA